MLIHDSKDTIINIILQYLTRLDNKELITPELYESVIQAASKIRDKNDFNTYIFSYLISTSIVDSLMIKLVNGRLKNTVTKEELKEYRTMIKQVEEEIQYDNEYCSNFLEKLNTLYEEELQKYSSKERLEELLPIEYAARFFKSLSTTLLSFFNTTKLSEGEIPADEILFIESCVELRKLFIANSILMIGSNYLQSKVNSIDNKYILGRIDEYNEKIEDSIKEESH